MKQSILSLFSFLLVTIVLGQPIKVVVKQSNDGWYLERGGEPYYIKGVGGSSHIDELLNIGANSVRTWGLNEADEALAIAEKNGLTVMLGLWVQHERHGFDYNDTAAVAKQLALFTEAVKKYKDHPALLLWGIGNEVDLFYSNTKVWDAIQDIAAMIKREDPNHPTTTVTAGLDSTEVYLIKTKAPDIDIYGINTYGDIGVVPNNIRKFGWEGPYIIAEWGPNGHWEVEKTKWGAPLEQNSTEKAASYRKRYDTYIKGDKEKCIGSYAFLWGQKQETTSTWYGLFTVDGHPSEPLDLLRYFWKGSFPNYPAPSIDSITLNGKVASENIVLTAGTSYTAALAFTLEGKQRSKVTWGVYPESFSTAAGGDFESALNPVMGVLSRRQKNAVTLKAPNKEGAYRLFVYVSGKGNRTAYANIPFYVNPPIAGEAPEKPIQLKRQSLSIER